MVAKTDTYSTAIPFAVGNSPQSVTTGDFNNDGKTDLVTANFVSNTISVLLNGSYSSIYPNGVVYSVNKFNANTIDPLNGSKSNNGGFVTVGDFNNDRESDLAVANIFSNSVSILLGNGDGSFRTPILSTVGPSPNAIAIADFNRDGKSDLAVIHAGKQVTIALGNGDGSFGNNLNPPTNFELGVGVLNAESITVGDFNGDGKFDLATANLAANNVSVLLGNGDGSFGKPFFNDFANFIVGIFPHFITTGDLNGDGKTDLVTANLDSTVSILLGSGNGSFGTATNIGVGGLEAKSVKIGDFNGDGKADLATANFSSNNVSVLFGNGDGTFGTPTTFAVGSGPDSLTVGDFNRDGRSDLATANYKDSSVSLLLNVSNRAPVNTLPAQVVYSGTQLALSGIFVSDVDNNLASTQLTVINGKLNVDLTVPPINPNEPGTPTITKGSNNSASLTLTGTPNQINAVLGTLKYQENPNFSGTTDSLTILSTDSAATPLTDTDTVSITIKRATPKITITPGTNATEGSTNGTFTINLDTPAPVGGLVVKFSTDSSNANASSDYSLAAGTNISTLTTNTFTIAAGATTATLNVVAAKDAITDPNETVTINLINVLGYVPATPALASTTSYSFLPLVGEFNGDGKSDLIVGSFNKQVEVLLGNGDGSFATPSTFAVGTDPSNMKIGDFNGDGKSDLVVADGSNNKVSVLLRNGNGSFTPPNTFTVQGNVSSMLVADFNGDGKSDLAVTNTQTSNIISILLANGDGSFAPRTNFVTGVFTTSITSGDFNGDGKSDLALTGDSWISVLLGSGNGTFGTATKIRAGSSPNSITSGDFNGDGKSDLAVADIFSRNIEVLLANGDGSFGNPIAFAVDDYPQSITAGDFNGDGKSDLTLIKRDNNISIQLGNGDGTFASATTVATVPGVGVGQISLTIGDFNGDGKPDIAAEKGSYQKSVSVFLNKAPSATISIADTSATIAEFKKDPAKYMGAIRDYDGNDLGSSSTWKSLGDIDINGDGTLENILVNPKIERFASVGSVGGNVDFTKYGLNGDTRVVGIYIDPTLKNQPQNIGGPFDSQRRFQNDLRIDNLKVLAAGDYNNDGFQDLYFKLGDGSAVLRALMFKDGNIQYANYQSKTDLSAFMTSNNVSSSVWGGWL